MGNPPRRPEGRFECKVSDDTTSAEVFIYGDIGASWWRDSVDPAAFVKEVSALDVDTMNVWVNSPGGDAFGGIAMMNALRRHKAHITVTVDGLAASAASYIALGGDELVMGRNSQLMIHDASAICWGNAADMVDTAAVLDKTSDSIAAAYAEKAGGSVEDWRDTMRAETWYTAEEAVEAGLADRVDDARLKEATAAFDLSIFAHAGREDAPAPRMVHPKIAALHEPPAQPGQPNTQTEGADMSDTLMAGLCDRLGIPAESELTEDGVFAALDEALAERADTTPTNEAPAGTVLVEADRFAQLEADAAEGKQARAEQVATRRDGIVDRAVGEGRITPANRQVWRDRLDENEDGTTALLNTLAPSVPLEAVGKTGGVEESNDDEKLYAAAFGSTIKEA